MLSIALLLKQLVQNQADHTLSHFLQAQDADQAVNSHFTHNNVVNDNIVMSIGDQLSSFPAEERQKEMEDSVIYDQVNAFEVGVHMQEEGFSFIRISLPFENQTSTIGDREEAKTIC